MRVADLDYALPEELIAQTPAAVRDDARLLVVDRGGPGRVHARVRELPDLLSPGDLLVLNDAKVVPARVHGRRPTGGRVEVLFCEAVEGPTWHVLARGAPRVGERVFFADGAGEWTEDLGGGQWRLRLEIDRPVPDWLDGVGDVPLPPYIRRPGGPTADDRHRYQTTFARVPGAVAAPTAGLHFTPALFEALAVRGVATAFLTLHVGPGTFLPIRGDDLASHHMPPERFALGRATVDAIAAARARKGRVVAVGTTTVRALESAAARGALEPQDGAADLFIAPGHEFRVVDALVTNFHLPRTSLLALVAAFAGWERIRAAYEEAVRERYRFYSFGDAMLVL